MDFLDFGRPSFNDFQPNRVAVGERHSQTTAPGDARGHSVSLPRHLHGDHHSPLVVPLYSATYIYIYVWLIMVHDLHMVNDGIYI